MSGTSISNSFTAPLVARFCWPALVTPLRAPAAWPAALESSRRDTSSTPRFICSKCIRIALGQAGVWVLLRGDRQKSSRPPNGDLLRFFISHTYSHVFILNYVQFIRSILVWSVRRQAFGVPVETSLNSQQEALRVPSLLHKAAPQFLFLPH
jgi:hypothetical protein